MSWRNVSQTQIRRIIVMIGLNFMAAMSFGLVQNGSFEVANGSLPANWAISGNVFRDQSVPRSGANVLKLFGNFNGGANTSSAYQNVPMKPGQRLSAVTYAYNKSTDAMSGNNFAVLKVIYRNASNVDLMSSESRQINAGTARNQWQKISASLGDAPAGTTHCAIFFLFIQPSSTPFASGAAFFDDVTVEIRNPQRYTQIWVDDFKGTSLNKKDWEPMIGDGSAYGIPGWGNNELQYYSSRSQNLVVSGGLLRIIARKESFGGRNYTSARIRTLNKPKGDFRYGRVEARMKVPIGQGLWSAFWMLSSSSAYGGWASSGEIDIMEIVNSTQQCLFTIHHGGAWPNNVYTGGNITRSSGFGDGFHVYAVEWEPDSIKWFVDGVQTYSLNSTQWYSSAVTWNQRAPFDVAFHMLINLAVGGNLPGDPNLSTVFPAELQVDWVRYSQLDQISYATPTPLEKL
jgi:beta-glucanase (GH16 family)